MPRGEKAEHDAGDERSKRSHCEDRGVERDLIAARNPIARQTREQQIQTPAADQHAAESTERDQQERFDEMTALNPGTAGAERESDRDFALPRRGANKLETGNI